MKICLAQLRSVKGDISKNIENHLRFIGLAIDHQADLIVFPELSLSGYEPTLAAELSTSKNDVIFDNFESVADRGKITIGVGMPVKNKEGIGIAMLIFRPDKSRQVYFKQTLHADELTYFSAGVKPCLLTIENEKISIGICYETLQREHILYADNKHASIYLASVAKSASGMDKAFTYYPEVAAEFKIPILMVNSVGDCDNFTSVGQTAIWDDSGKILGKLDRNKEGILLFDSRRQIIKKLEL